MIYLASTNGVSNRHHILRMFALAGGRPRRRRVPRPRFPRQAERDYLRELLAIVDEMDAVTQRAAASELPAIMADARANQPTVDAVSLDAWGDRIANLVATIRATLVGVFDEAALMTIIRRIANRTDTLNAAQQQKFMRAVLGVDVLASEPWLAAHMEAFVQANVGLIKGIEEQYLGEVQKILFDGARSGLRHEAIAAELRARPHLRLEARAAYIARNQVAQFNSTLNRARQQQVGINGYFWRGILDERERPDHVMREGMRFSWDKPPAGGDHPGHEPNCRCSAEPDMTPFFDGDEEEAA